MCGVPEKQSVPCPCSDWPDTTGSEYIYSSLNNTSWLNYKYLHGAHGACDLQLFYMYRCIHVKTVLTLNQQPL